MYIAYRMTTGATGTVTVLKANAAWTFRYMANQDIYSHLAMFDAQGILIQKFSR